MIESGVTIASVSVPATLRLDTISETSRKLEATLTPAEAPASALEWSSDDPDVARVDDAGNVTAVSAGTATVTAKVRGGAIGAACKVYVFALWFHDDFGGGTSQWDLHPPDGMFSVSDDGGPVLAYRANMTGGVLGTATPEAWSSVPSGDYYVEARIKPQTNSATGNKQLYLLARYQDEKNWYGAGLNVQSSTASTQVEIAEMRDGSLARPGQVKTPIALDSTWYTVRFQLQGDMLSVYLNGVLMKSVSDDQWQSGPIGLYTSNKSFELDDVKVGDPKDLPTQLAIDTETLSVEAKSAPEQVRVTAQRPDYDTGQYVDDSFSAASSDPSVVSVSIDGELATLTPLAAGVATVTFTSGSDPALTRTLAATVEPEFVQPSAKYELGQRVSPAQGESSAYADTRLSIALDAAPALGDTGSVRIFRKRDDAQVDTIRAKNETNAIGYRGRDGQAPIRYVNSDSRIQLDGNEVVITPHDGVLDYGTEYYVAIADGLIDGSVNGTAFRGIGKAAGWTFTTQTEPDASKTRVIVDDDGTSADFRTVQAALDFAMKQSDASAPFTIEVKDGTYEELLFLRGRDNVSIVGESRTGTVIQARNYESLNSGSGASQASASGTPAGGRAVFLVENADMLTLDTLTLKNTMQRSTSASSQAETIYWNNDAGRLIAKHADFISEQDTLQLKGYAWFYDTLVAGNVDFIWGANHVALFEDSEIRSLGDSAGGGSGYVVQARTVAQSDAGFVFLHDSFTHAVGPSGAEVASGADAATYFARSSGSATAWDNVAIIDCDVGDHIAPVGWAYDLAGQPKSNPSMSTAASGWREYGSRGAGGDMTQRRHGYALTEDEYAAAFSSRVRVFAAYGGGSGWSPMP
jgi:pectin methylesterase-like acyl-CoA thioesterase